jgi:hypothetical protein
MIKLLFRLVLVIAGVAFFGDALLPAKTQSMLIDRHTSFIDNQSADTDYSLSMAGGSVGSCSVGYQSFHDLKDGETVTVKYSALLKRCLEISRNRDVVYYARFWRLISAIFGAVLIGGGIGWLKSNDDEDIQIG